MAIRTILASAALAATVALAPLPAAAANAEATDKVIFHSGNIIEGKVLEETATEIKMLVVMGSMSAEMTYPKADILKIERDVIDATAVASAEIPDGDVPALDARNERDDEADLDGAYRVYHIKLNGQFGRDISETPIRDSIEDARDEGATHIIIELNNTWQRRGEDLNDNAGNFDEFSRAEAITPIFTEEIRTEWSNPPEVVFWVRNAMGGSAFLPFLSPNMYFHSEGRMGGVGNLAGMFGNMGDEVVRDKQESLRAGRARGLAIHGGYDGRIITAMTEVPYQLWLRFERGQPVLIDNPDDVLPSDILLTDDGEDENADTVVELVRDEGNDVLTLRADTAFQMGISDGTADTLDDLLFDLGIDQDSVVIEGRAERINDRWRTTIDRSERELRSLYQDYTEVPGGGDRRERARSRGQRSRLLDQMERILVRFGEAVIPGRIGVPINITWIEDQRNVIKAEAIADR